MITGESDLIYTYGELARSVAVIVPLYNYEQYIRETLESVAAQTEDDLCLIVINDCSNDDSLSVARDWMVGNALGDKSGFLLSHRANSGLSATRNTGIAFARSDYCFFLDADNILYPSCIEKHAAALRDHPRANAAYGVIEIFDGDAGVQGTNVFNRERLKHGNYIDAMAMVRRDYLLSIDGFYPMRHGWEDYDLWLRMCEDESEVIQVPEILSRYRVHQSSMLRTQTNLQDNMRDLQAAICERHPWLELWAIP